MRARERVVAMVRGTPHLAAALAAAREVGAPDWWIAAGAVRDAVWDALHERAPEVPRDVDLIFFDAAGDELAVLDALTALEPELPWQAKNQARVHEWYGERFGREVPPFRSAAEAVATFPETASCVGVRLEAAGEVSVVAPHGLDDLLGCVCRHNPARVTAEFYERRVREKGWRERWPRMRYVAPG